MSDELPLDVLRQIDNAASRFERLWNTSEEVSIESLLAEAPAEYRKAMLRELLALEIELRRQRGDAMLPMEFQKRFPEAIELITELLSSPSTASITVDFVPGSVPPIDFDRNQNLQGSSIGPYELEHELGAGGMGVVWVARQQHPVKRRVALKLIKAGMDSREVVRRFEHERQALAVLDHPNIARVLDGGLTADGRPYFAMELVNGLPLTRFCDEAKLSLKQRLDIFQQICMAVQHAHQKGLIHRDLKPANILVTMVDGKPVPKVIDFGIAKALSEKLTEETIETQFGAVVGTLEFMAPEQAGYSGIDVDTRADVYSLGVILYELLTGLRPFDTKRLRQAALDEIIRIIREEEPSKPSTRISSAEGLPSLAAVRQTEPGRLSRYLQGDLDWIVLKCLEKDRNRRYDTAYQLALEIQRYLADEPVQAGPPSAAYRLRKFARRNRWSLATCGMVLGALVAGLIISLWQMNRAILAEREESRQRKLAVDRAAEAKRNAEIAEKNAARAAEANRQARAALDTVTDDVVQNLISKQTNLGDVEKQFLKKMIAQYEQFTEITSEAPDALRLNADGFWKIALLQERLGANEDATAAFQGLRDVYQRLLRSNPDDLTNRVNVAAAYRMASWNLGFQERFVESEQFLAEARELLEGVMKESPNRGDVLEWMSMVELDSGNILIRKGKVEEAEQAFRRGIALERRLLETHPDNPNAVRLLADGLLRLAGLLQTDGETNDALKAAEEASQLVDNLVQKVPRELDNAHVSGMYLQSRYLQAVLLSTLHDDVRAADVYRTMIAAAEEFMRERPAEPSNRVHLVTARLELARCLIKFSQPQEALQELHTAEEASTRLIAAYPSKASYKEQLLAVQIETAWLLRNLNMRNDALQWFRRALGTQEELRVNGQNDLQIDRAAASIREMVGHTLCEIGSFQEAANEFNLASADLQRFADAKPDQPELQFELAKFHEYRNWAFLAARSFSSASEERATAIEILQALSTTYPKRLEYRQKLGDLYHMAGDRLAQADLRDEAIDNFRRAVEVRLEILQLNPDTGGNRDKLAWSYRNLGSQLFSQRKFAEGLAMFDSAIATITAKAEHSPEDGKFREECAYAIDRYAEDNLRARGNPQAALEAFRHVLKIREALVADYPADGVFSFHRGRSLYNIGYALLDLQEFDEANEQFQHCAQLQTAHAHTFPLDRNSRAGYANTVNLLGERFRAKGKWETAKEFYLLGLKAREAVAHDFPGERAYRIAVVESHSNVADMLVSLQHYEEATVQVRAACDLADELMRESPNDQELCRTYDEFILRCCEYLANANLSRDISYIVDQYHNCVQASREPPLLPEATILSYGGLAHLKLQEYEPAERLLRECLAIREQVAANAWQTFNSKSFLGEALLGQGRYDEAEPLLLAGFQGLLARQGSIPEGFSNRLPEAAERLVKWAEATQNQVELQKWQAEVTRLRGDK